MAFHFLKFLFFILSLKDTRKCNCLINYSNNVYNSLKYSIESGNTNRNENRVSLSIPGSMLTKKTLKIKEIHFQLSEIPERFYYIPFLNRSYFLYSTVCYVSWCFPHSPYIKPIYSLTTSQVGALSRQSDKWRGEERGENTNYIKIK